MVNTTGRVYGPKTFASTLDEMHQAATGKIKGRTVVARGGAVSVGKKQNAFIAFLTAIASRIPHLKHKIPTINPKKVTQGYIAYIKDNQQEIEKVANLRKAKFIFLELRKGLASEDRAKLEKDFDQLITAEMKDKFKKEVSQQFKTGGFRTTSTRGKRVLKTVSGKAKITKTTASGRTTKAKKSTPVKRLVKTASGKTTATRATSGLVKGERAIPRAPLKAPAKTKSAPKKEAGKLKGVPPKTTAGKAKSVPAKRKSV
ncbi:MAG: hypothetical protein CK425_10160 [Parachlamydia sp.]|nr:MAG: hypothetical protein CK425_10160 [Parachlamydia sp.]